MKTHATLKCKVVRTVINYAGGLIAGVLFQGLQDLFGYRGRGGDVRALGLESHNAGISFKCNEVHKIGL